MALFTRLGFLNHPFSKTNADEEPELAKYFVPPPFYDSVVGDPDTPNASVVLAPRGGGKTALRRMLEEQAFNNGFLPVTYDRYEFGAGQKVEDVNLQYHLRNIISRLLVAYLSYLADNPDLIRRLKKEDKKHLSIFIHSYLGDITGDSLQELLKELKGLPERFRDFWRNNVGVLESLVNILLKRYGLDKIDLPEAKQQEKKLIETYKYQLEYLYSLTKQLGFKAIYILIDKPDETEQTGNDPEATYCLIRPMLRDLELLGLRGYGFKFFLWEKIEPFYCQDARPDRVYQYNLSWSREDLKIILSKRLRAFSNENIRSFNELCEKKLQFDVDDVICLLANGSPRNVIRICEKIFSMQAEINSQATSISFPAIDQGILSYCEQITKEVYGEKTIKEIQRIGQELFTINFLSNEIFKVNYNSIRNRITSWLNMGLVKQIGTISVASSKKPLNFYCVVDPAVVRLIHRRLSIDSFIKDLWIPCNFCQADNLMDITHFKDENVPICVKCGRNLF